MRDLLLASLVLGSLACSGGGGDRPDADAGDFVPAPATLHRLTDSQIRTSVRDLLGVGYDGELPVDYSLHGYVSVGASQITIAPHDLELYEAAAWAVADAAVPDAGDFLGCTPDPECVRGWTVGFGRQAWRRPLSPAEVDVLVGLWRSVDEQGGVLLATRALVASIVLSPHFLFRVEIGEAIEDLPGIRRFTDWEMAARLAFFLTDATPDAALLDAAERGELTTDAGLRAQALRLLGSDRARAALSGFFAETVDLSKVFTVDKDAARFPEMTTSLRGAMADELLALFEWVAIDNDADLRTLLTSSDAWVTPELAALYGLGDVAGWVTLPDERGGILGRAGLLAVNSHATMNSPTYRGKFVRARLLCQSIAPPPEGVIASLEGSTVQGSLRDRLSQHASDPACTSCHSLMDPIGFGLEHFDPIGRWRDLDDGYAIDATGEIDGVSFDGARELGRVVAEHPDFGGCVALQLYRHAGGHAETYAELPAIDALTGSFVAGGHRLQGLVLDLVLSDAFRTASAPATGTCDDEGATRACDSGCGEGEEICLDGQWLGCDAPVPVPESCNGVDDDCDGDVDGHARSCDATFGPGTQTCTDGAWGGCHGPDAPDEECNGIDDDADGQVDEGLEVDVVTVAYADLVAQHGSCDPGSDTLSGPCNAAINRHCAATGCHTTGFGAVGHGSGTADVVCLDDLEAEPVQTTYTTLASHHPTCTATARHGPGCNAAINRFCNSIGLTTGFGPVEDQGDNAYVVCTPNADLFETSYTALSTFAGSCDGSTERMGDACNEAFHRYCRASGYASGHGPLENSGDVAYVACVGGE